MLFRSKCAMGMFLCFGLFAGHAAEAALVTYSMTTASGVVESGVTATDIASSAVTTRAVTLTINYSQVPNNIAPAAADGSVLRVQGIDDTSIATSDETFFFTLTPPAGQQFDLTSIEYDIGAGGSGTRQAYVRYSFDGGANFTSTAVATASTTTNQYNRITRALVDQDAGANLTSSPVLFEFIVATPASSNDLRFDNIIVNGTVVPEPAALSALALTGLLLGRRNRRAQR